MTPPASEHGSIEPVVPCGDGGLDRLLRLRLDLAYDGGAFSGWAAQPGRRTVQDTVERGLATVLRLREPARSTVAGRTDAGVHAAAQVAHVDVPAQAWEPLEPLVVMRRLAGILPPDVRVSQIAVAPFGFDARFSAGGRRYGYRVCDGPSGAPPLRRHDTLAVAGPLDVAAMQEAAEQLLGEHDFAAFCRRREGATTIRTLRRLQWSREPDGVLLATVEADAFCHSMVRSLVGALLAVGGGRRASGFPGSLLTRTERAGDVVVAPPHGLTLLGVEYPPDDQLAARAEQARNVRSLARPSA